MHLRFFADRAGTLAQAHLPAERQASTSGSGSGAMGSGGRAECAICCEMGPADRLVAMECRHGFCAGCWRAYLGQKVMEEGVSISIACPAHNCVLAVGDDLVRSLVDDAIVRRRYAKLITNSFVEVPLLPPRPPLLVLSRTRGCSAPGRCAGARRRAAGGR